MNMLRWLVLAACTLPAFGAQFAKFGDIEVHYVVVGTMFLTEDVASKHGIERGPDRAFVNLSVLKSDMPVRARVSGSVTNLLGHTRKLEFREVMEERAIYYLASLEHDDEDTLRFAIDVTVDAGPTHRVAFQETLYLEPSASRDRAKE